MFCMNCGKEIDDKAVICVHCGVATPNMQKMNQPPQAPVQAPPAAQAPPIIINNNNSAVATSRATAYGGRIRRRRSGLVDLLMIILTGVPSRPKTERI